ncbi:hypothetical protein L195_g018596 [Trifolium pratense]|uniref:Uncharacterized protein n=1 Tax=Trifolium pratense TaxID=57577 RepID=A0A2K3MX75_TRIPR|nr:hypothetical protein L195_g018596 [Trifolium pratense]
MKRALNKVNLGDSHISENSESPNSGNKRIRLERRLRRWDARNDSLQHNRVASAKRKTATNHSGGSNIGVNVSNSNDSDEVDPDYALFLNSVTIVDGDEEYMRVKNTTNTSVREDGRNSSKIDSAINHSGGSNIGIGVGNGNDSDEVDPDYALFLNSVTIVDGDDEYMHVKNTTNTSVGEDGRSSSKIDSASNHSGGSNVGFGNDNDSDEVDPDYALFLNSVWIVDGDEEYMRVKNTTNTSVGEDRRNSSKIDSASNRSGSSNIGVDIGNSNDSDEVDPDYALFLNSVTIVDGDDEYMRVKNTTNTSVWEDGRNSSKIDSASNHSGGSNIGVSVGNGNDSDEVDPDYTLPLNSVSIVDGDEEYMRVKNTTNTSQVENRSNSSDSDLIVLESYPTCGNTPFIPSKMYDSSWFGEEMNPKDNVQTPAYDDSHFRRRLMEHLERPYDLKEYKDLINRLINRTQKEHSEGVITPYHEMYPDISKAIAKVSKERPKVLYLLRKGALTHQSYHFVSRSYRVESSNRSLANAMFDHSFEFDPVMEGDLKHGAAPMKQ